MVSISIREAVGRTIQFCDDARRGKSLRLYLSASLALFILCAVGPAFAQVGMFEQGTGEPASAGTPSSPGSPITGASVYMYAVGTNGYGANPASLLAYNGGTNGVQKDSDGNTYLVTDADGKFNLTALYNCPTPDPQVYLVAVGGSTGHANSNYLVEVSALPVTCSQLYGVPNIYINEATTVSAAYALGSLTALGTTNISMFGVGGQTMTDAFAFANSLVDSTTGHVLSTNGSALTIGTFANFLNACVSLANPNSCSDLATVAPNVAGSSPSLWQSALAMAYGSAGNAAAISELYNLLTPEAPFIPYLENSPTSWVLPGIEIPTLAPLSRACSHYCLAFC